MHRPTYISRELHVRVLNLSLHPLMANTKQNFSDYQTKKNHSKHIHYGAVIITCIQQFDNVNALQSPIFIRSLQTFFLNTLSWITLVEFKDQLIHIFYSKMDTLIFAMEM